MDWHCKIFGHVEHVVTDYEIGEISSPDGEPRPIKIRVKTTRCKRRNYQQC